jgi:chorismate dehydratase
MNTIKISAISYLNTVPFIWGIQHYKGLSGFSLGYDVPSSCAEKLIHGDTDIGIVPVATIPYIPNAEIVTDFCIGALKAVNTVVLAAHRPLGEIDTIYLDPDSRTSARLSRILARYHWKKDFHFLPLQSHSWSMLKPNEAAVLIGDKTFGLERHFQHITDLATEWYNFTGLPFVFACWVSNKQLPEAWLSDFNKALSYGIHNIGKVVMDMDSSRYSKVDIHHYLTECISYPFDEQKKKGMALFLDYCMKVTQD